MGCAVLVVLSTGCGLSDGVLDSTASDEVNVDQEVRGKPGCSVSPSAAPVGTEYLVAIRGMKRSEPLAVHLTDAAGTRDFQVTTDANGAASLTSTSSSAGPGSVGVEATRRGVVVSVASCRFDVITPPVCGDAVCNGSETCSTCAADCGACPPVCGDAVCNGTETCSTCAADCGACPPACGDAVCNGTETCSTCAADCGPCLTCEPAVTSYPSGQHNAGRDCMGCHDGSGPAPLWTIAGTLYADSAGTSAVAGATILAQDATGRVIKLVTSANGNFYTGDTTIRFPLAVGASKCPNTRSMFSSVGTGACNGCHTAGGRISLP